MGDETQTPMSSSSSQLLFLQSEYQQLSQRYYADIRLLKRQYKLLEEARMLLAFKSLPLLGQLAYFWGNIPF